MPDPALEARTRIDLAVAFRWAARLGMHEAVANHFSAAVSDDGSRFLLNPVGAHFSRICAGDLLLRDAADPHAVRGPNAPDPTARYLHAEPHFQALKDILDRDEPDYAHG